MSDTNTHKHSFNADVKKVLDIVVNSLYTDKEVFVRELISNASDALEKLRHIQLSESQIHDASLNLEIQVHTDESAGTLTIQDFGIGMNEEELTQNLGTIAHSGSKAFVEALQESAEVAGSLIGQFGVGFYSVFMVAEKVEVFTRSWRPDGQGLKWTSDGSGEYEIEPCDGERRGTKIVITLKENSKEFAKADTLKSIIQRYSAFVQHPVLVDGEKLNTVQAIWTRSKSDVSEEEYKEFYKFQANAWDDPRFWLHFSSDAPININALLFVPTENPEKFGFSHSEHGVSLYCKKVLIDHHPKGLLPEWMRFVKGVIDSADLPLNISRESMQDSQLVQKIGTVLTKRFIKFLAEQANKDAEAYQQFWEAFGHYIKEGITSDPVNKEALSKLLRYESSLTEPGKTTSLEDYISRAKEGQKQIYFLLGSNRKTIENGPYLEAFKANNLEVLYLYEGVDEFVMNHLRTFAEKELVSADQEGLELESVTVDTDAGALTEEQGKALCEWMKEQFGESVSEVKISSRLVNNPAVALSKDKLMTANMRRIMKAMNQEMPSEVPVQLELNPTHPLILKLHELRSSGSSNAPLVAEQILDNCRIAAGLMEDPQPMVQRIYSLLQNIN
ncbi:MAG: molecular chaperone HtpG [Puniceicoccaceae bacterium]